jgi:DNA-binding MarR family transcriptional regulator
MEKTELNLIEDPVDLEIISNIDDKKNITAISTATGYTYKTVFHRIKRLEKEGLVKLEKTKDITEGAILTIPSEVKEKIDHEIRRYTSAKIDLEKSLQDKNKLKQIIEILEYVENNRLICKHDLDSFTWNKYFDCNQHLSALFAISNLIGSGRLRSRIEITRAGKKLLKDNSKK